MYILIIIFVIGSIFAFIGDLLISYFKRKSGVKDTGTILPGHGGVLDRVDSHLLTTPILILIIIML
jgi:phosphatidate cytidylyltransferase